MNSRWNRADGPARRIRCAIVEVPAMNDPHDRSRRNGFNDLVPWADPYIAALVEKLRRSDDFLDEEAVDELPPPLGSQDNERDEHWPHDWTPRNWPRG